MKLLLVDEGTQRILTLKELRDKDFIKQVLEEATADAVIQAKNRKKSINRELYEKD